MSFLGNCTGTALLAASGVLVLLGAILGFVLMRGPAPLVRQHPGWAAVAGAVVVGLAAGSASLTASSCQAVPAACLGVQFAGRTNLVANPGFAAAATGPAPSTWVLSGTLAGGAPAGTIAPQMGTDLTSARIRVRPAADYCYQVDLTGTGHGQVLLLW